MLFNQLLNAAKTAFPAPRSLSLEVVLVKRQKAETVRVVVVVGYLRVYGPPATTMPSTVS